ncbi:S8/S53 family peptidase [bacterium]|nr:S8/S53 family peptidase [bacterium]
MANAFPGMGFNPSFTPPTPNIPPVCRDGNGETNGKARPGSLVVVDNQFVCNDVYEGHGSLVSRSARSSGFQGPIQRQQLSFGPGPNGLGLFEPNLSPAEARKRLEAQASSMVTGNLNSYTAALNHQSAAGVKNSVVNLSGGLNKADVFRNMMNSALASPETMDNAFRAAGVDKDKMASPDPKVSGPEHLKFQQMMMDSINRGLDGNPQVGKARRNYDQAVQRFEANHNSVVVAVGNTGEDRGRIHPGVKVPDDFDRSFNINDQVTAVGSSLRGLGRASYSANERNNIIYAEGLAPGDNLPQGQTQVADGTSYAAPRVSALMAEIHRRHPKLTSQQAENLLRQQLTDERGGYTEVDPLKARRFLAEG